MPRTYVMPYSMGSLSARRLAAGLGARLLSHGDTTYRPERGDVIINWGCSKVPVWYFNEGFELLNNHDVVNRAINKLDTLTILARECVPAPVFTTDRAGAAVWLNNGHKVVARLTNDGSNGRGARVLSGPCSPNQVPEAPLYTKHIPIHREFRVDYLGGILVWEARKVRRAGRQCDPDIRTYDNGWLYNVSDPQVPYRAREVANQTITALGLDFGAVDIIETSVGECYALEVNTAPGAGPAETRAWVRAFQQYLERN